MVKTYLNLLVLRKVLVICVISMPVFSQVQAQIADKSCPPPPLPLDQQMAYVANATAKNAGYLWRIEKDGRTSWLYGTMHLNHIDYAKPGPQIMVGMRSSDVLALEINPYEPQNLPPSFQLPQFQLSSSQIERLSRAYARDCLPLNATAVSPVSGTMPLLTSQAQRQALFSGFSPDSRLAQIAKRSGKSIVQLENLEQHIKALAPSSQTDFDQSFEATLNGVESGKMQAEVLQLNKAWQQNDWSAIVKLEQDISTNQPAFATRLLDQRNILMAEKIDALHRDGKRAFVAVGALHMAGKTALPQLLQDKGYAVTYVPLRN